MFEYLKCSLTVRCCTNSIQNNLEIQELSCSCLVLLPLPQSQNRKWSLAQLQGMAMSMGFACLVCVWVCLSMYMLGIKRRMDVVDAQGYFRKQTITYALAQIKQLYH